MLKAPPLISWDLHFSVLYGYCQTYVENIGQKLQKPRFVTLETMKFGLCERGDAQNLLSTTGNSQKVKGYAQVKVRAMPKCVRRAMPKSVRRAMPKSVRRAMPKNYKVQWAIAKRLRAMPKLK